MKPYILLILLTVALLFVQANAELALPDYMSKIVNVGIQQSGVENAVAEAIRQAQLDKLLIFMTAEEQSLVLSNYTLVEHNSPDYDQYVVQDMIDSLAIITEKAISCLKNENEILISKK